MTSSQLMNFFHMFNNKLDKVLPHLSAEGGRGLRLAGVACASMSGAGWAARRACVERRPLGDGVWHTVCAERHGHNLRVSVDDGDGWCLNETLTSVETPGGAGRPPPLMVDKHDGVTVGGLPEFLGVNLVTVQDDLQDSESCGVVVG